MSAKKDEFRDYCLELLSGLRQGEIVAKKMFGGTGFSIDSKNFAIIAFDQLWLKVDTESERTFLDAGCRIFTYTWNDGVERNLGYYTVPDDAMESSALMRPWAMLGWAAAVRAAAQKTAKGTKKTKTNVDTKPAKKTTVKPVAKMTTKSAATSKKQ